MPRLHIHPVRGFCVGLAALIAGSVAEAQTLVAHYNLNETTGSMCFDASPNALHGTYRNGFTLGDAASAVGCGTSVAFDAAALTDVEILGATALDSLSSDLTVCAWVNPAVIPGPNAVMRIFGNNNAAWMCGLRGDGLIFTTRFIQDYFINGVNLTPGAWTHIAYTFDANYTVEFFVDGVSVGSVPGAAPAGLPNAEWFIGGFDGLIEFWDGSIDDVQIYDGALSAAQIAGLAQPGCDTLGGLGVGTNYCGPAVANGAGLSAVMSATGSLVAAQNDLVLACSDMPQVVWSFFLVSRMQGFVPQPGGSAGNLCLGGAIGRYVGPGQIQNSGGMGVVELALDLTQIPQPNGFVAAVSGDTWNFQCWFRDTQMGMATSNFSDGITVTFF